MMKPMPGTNGQHSVWAVTTYFNPMRYRRRLANFHIFRAALELPLLAVELSFGEPFELGNWAADKLIQCRGRDVLWQKERLLNIAIKGLPASCTKVVWLDCDIVFTRSGWIEKASRELDRFPLIQPFSRLHHLPPDQWGDGERAGEPLLQQPSAVRAVAGGIPPRECFRLRTKDRRGDVAVGMAWGARRSLLEQHGLFDACIIGGGDRALACAAYGCFEVAVAMMAMNRHQEDYYLSWARPFYESVRGAVSFIDADVQHLWHGNLIDRRTGERQLGLGAFDFDPYRDIADDTSGCWRWNSDKPALHAYLRKYFASRNEDGARGQIAPSLNESRA
jgi:hypothetical protein